MTRYRDALAFCAVACLWGLSLAVVEVGLRSFPPLLLSAFRYYLAGGLLLGYVGATAECWLPSTRGDLVAVAGGGVFWIAIGNGVWFVGQALTTSVLSGLMVSLTPIATVAVSWVLLPEDRLTAASVAGVVVSFGGAVLMLWPTGATAAAGSELGKAILLVGVLGLGVGSVLLRRASASLPSAARVGWSALAGAAVIQGLSALRGERWAASVADASWPGVAAILYLGVAATAVAYVLFFGLLDRHPAIEVSLLTYFVPVVAAVTGWALFGERVTARMAAGFLVVLVGFALLKRRALREEVARLRGRTE